MTSVNPLSKKIQEGMVITTCNRTFVLARSKIGKMDASTKKAWSTYFLSTNALFPICVLYALVSNHSAPMVSLQMTTWITIGGKLRTTSQSLMTVNAIDSILMTGEIPLTTLRKSSLTMKSSVLMKNPAFIISVTSLNANWENPGQP